MEPEGLLPCSQGPGSGPYPDPDASSLTPSHDISIRFILILSYHLRLDLPYIYIVSYEVHFPFMSPLFLFPPILYKGM